MVEALAAVTVPSLEKAGLSWGILSIKTFLMYLLQFPLFSGFAKYLYGFKPQQHYLLGLD